jgi:hypothetical protein
MQSIIQTITTRQINLLDYVNVKNPFKQKEKLVQRAINICVPLTILILTILYIIDQNAQFVLQRVRKSNRLNQDGAQPAIKKSWPVIVVDLDQDMLVSCWCIMWTVISITQYYVT